MRKILALTVVGAVSLSSMVTAMAQQNPQSPNQAPSRQSPQSTPSQAPSSEAPSSQAPSNRAPADQIDSTRTPSNERSLSEFWTPDRLRGARPMPTPRVDPDEVKK